MKKNEIDTISNKNGVPIVSRRHLLRGLNRIKIKYFPMKDSFSPVLTGALKGSPGGLFIKNDAVSPVVGVMLMLAVTLILAAVISGFTGGLAKIQEKPPQILFEATMVHNTEDSDKSFLDIRMLSVSEGIPTADIKIQTEWKNQTSTHRSVITPHSPIVGTQTYPLGYGPGVREGDEGSDNFGNYTLLAGTRMYVNATESHDAMNAVLTPYWDAADGGITEGTPLRIQVVHIPSGAIIADKEITVEE